MKMKLYIFLLQIRNFFVVPFFHFGSTIIRCTNKGCYELTVGKEYRSERRDMVSFYLLDDKGQLVEITKNHFKIVKKIIS